MKAISPHFDMISNFVPFTRDSTQVVGSKGEAVISKHLLGHDGEELGVGLRFKSMGAQESESRCSHWLIGRPAYPRGKGGTIHAMVR